MADIRPVLPGMILVSFFRETLWTTRPPRSLKAQMPAAMTTSQGPITSFGTRRMPLARHRDYRVNLFDNNHTATRTLILCLLLVAVCYSNSIPNAFILDDILIVGANERIRHIDPLHFLFQSYWGDLNHAGIYRPLTIFSDRKSTRLNS